MNKRLEIFKKAVEAKAKFYADDFTWAYRERKDKLPAICWFMFLKNNVYGDEIILPYAKDIEIMEKAIRTLEEQAIRSYENLVLTLNNPGRLIDTVDSQGKCQYGVSAKVETGDVQDLQGHLLKISPTIKLFDSKETLLEFLVSL